jgi:EF-P beta-lysylation protein EpmB
MDYKRLWQKNFHNVKKLFDFLHLPPQSEKEILFNPSFPLNLPIRLAEKITKKNLNDPILLQFMPLKKELLKQKKTFSKNPLKEDKFRTNHLLKKYEKRVLLLTCDTCCMHCRFCFRRNFEIETMKNFNLEITNIKNTKSIEEVILSGGDPLSLSNKQLKNLLTALNDIPHVKRIRIHSRFLIGLPERLDDELIEILANIKKQLYFVTHINHFKELDDDIIAAFKKLLILKIPLFNQSVLLKNINDDVATLLQLNTLLINNGIIPYYLHQLDQVEGASHFEVSAKNGKKLITHLLEKLPGYGVPRYVKEIPYKKSKTPIA